MCRRGLIAGLILAAALAAQPAAAQVRFILDTFTDANNTLLESHNPSVRQGLALALQPSENGLYVAFYEAAGRVKSFVLLVGALSSSCFC